MRRQQHGTKGDENQNLADGVVGGWEGSADTGSSPFAITNDTNESTPFSSNAATTGTTPLFTSQSQIQPSSARNPFQFQSQANSARPTPQLTTRIRQNRDTRRSLFLDRLRSSRRDERDNNIIEKFEKEEYWRERKRREERMAREAEGWVGWDEEEEVDEEGNVVGEDDEWNGEMSPVDEEREVGELVEGWYEAQREGQGPGQGPNQTHGGPGVSEEEQKQNQEDDFMDAQFDFEDSDVEEVFMQVLSQQERQQQTQQLRDGSTTAPTGLGGEQDLTPWDAEMS